MLDAVWLIHIIKIKCLKLLSTSLNRSWINEFYLCDIRDWILARGQRYVIQLYFTENKTSEQRLVLNFYLKQLIIIYMWIFCISFFRIGSAAVLDVRKHVHCNFYQNLNVITITRSNRNIWIVYSTQRIHDRLNLTLWYNWPKYSHCQSSHMFSI